MKGVSDLEGIGLRNISLDTDAFVEAFGSDEEDEGFYEELTSDDEQAEYQELMEKEMNLKPVEVDMNLVRNLLEAYKAEAGRTGPASTLLKNLGIDLPDDEIE
jgi:hypothetical protein